MNSMTTAVIVIVAVAAMALLLRRLSGGGSERTLSGPAPGSPGESGTTRPLPAIGEEPVEEEEGEGAAGDAMALLTSHGLMFLPFERGVQLLAPATPEQATQELHTGAVARGRVAGVLTRGDLLGARVVRGAPSVDPWRLEAIGREGEYLDWSFETESAARAALELLERLVVQPPRDEDGEPAPPGPEAFAEARRVIEETERELANMPDEPEPEEEPR